MVIHWGALLLGFFLGLLVGVLFFAGLAWGLRIALRSTRPGVVLLCSALCRIAMLLAVGFWVAASTDNAWSLAGYATAFFLARLVAVLWVRPARGPALPGQGRV